MEVKNVVDGGGGFQESDLLLQTLRASPQPLLLPPASLEKSWRLEIGDWVSAPAGEETASAVSLWVTVNRCASDKLQTLSCHTKHVSHIVTPQNPFSIFM